MDDEIIHSWCFHDVECFDSTPSAAIIILDKDLESFLSLRSQQMVEMMVDVVEMMVEEDISQLIFLFFTSHFSLSLIFLLPFFFFPLFFSKFKKNLHEIRIWRSFWFF